MWRSASHRLNDYAVSLVRAWRQFSWFRSRQRSAVILRDALPINDASAEANSQANRVANDAHFVLPFECTFAMKSYSYYQLWSAHVLLVGKICLSFFNELNEMARTASDSERVSD